MIFVDLLKKHLLGVLIWYVLDHDSGSRVFQVDDVIDAQLEPPLIIRVSHVLLFLYLVIKATLIAQASLRRPLVRHKRIVVSRFLLTRIFLLQSLSTHLDLLQYLMVVRVLSFLLLKLSLVFLEIILGSLLSELMLDILTFRFLLEGLNEFCGLSPLLLPLLVPVRSA
jgi:hypothetical protein